MLGLIWLLYLVFGIITRSLPPLVTPITKELKITFVQMGLILGSWQLVYIVFAAIDGAVIDRWGIRKSLLAGIIVLALSEALRYFANGFTFLLFCVALIGVGGLGEPIISGLNLNDYNTILQGAIPAALLALLVQFFFDGLDRIFVPKGLRLKQ